MLRQFLCFSVALLACIATIKGNIINAHPIVTTVCRDN